MWIVIVIRESKACENQGVGLFVYIASDNCSLVETVIIHESEACGSQGVGLFVYIAIEIHNGCRDANTGVSVSICFLKITKYASSRSCIRI